MENQFNIWVKGILNILGLSNFIRHIVKYLIGNNVLLIDRTKDIVGVEAKNTKIDIM